MLDVVGRITSMGFVGYLLGNTTTYGDHENPIRILARTVDGVFELTVTNQGEPISDKAMENLFKPRGERFSQQGLGLGLFIASQIANARRRTDGFFGPGADHFVFVMPQQLV